MTSKRPEQLATPWHESNRVWVPFVLGVTFSLAGLPREFHDLIWLFIVLAWLCFSVATYMVVMRTTQDATIISGLSIVLIAVVSYAYGSWLSHRTGTVEHTAVVQKTAPVETYIPVSAPSQSEKLEPPKSDSKKEKYASRGPETTRPPIHEAAAQEPTQPGYAAPAPVATNNAPGGIIITGGQVIHPEVHNDRNPLPPVEISHIIEIKPQQLFQNDPHTGVPKPWRVTSPGASVDVVLKGVFYNPAFVADCDVPCFLENQSFVTEGWEGSNSEDFSPIATPDKLHAGAVIHKAELYPGVHLRLLFRSLDERTLHISNVRPYAQ